MSTDQQAPADEATQRNRFLGIETPLGEDVLLLTSFEGADALSQPFSFHAGMLATRESIASDEMLGRRVTVRVGPEDEDPRYFNGYVIQFSPMGRQWEYYCYSAEIVPWLSLLGYNSDCRIFQNLTVPEILEQVFQDRGFSDFDTSGLRANYKRREYCVQYRESDFAFVSRLMEEEGIFYSFRHEQRRHTLMLADGRHAYRFGSQREIAYVSAHGSRIPTEGISGWERTQAFLPGRYTHEDYNYETPRTNLQAGENSLVAEGQNGNYEIYDYPGLHKDPDEGRRRARVRIEGIETFHDAISGISTCRSLAAGTKFTLTGNGACEDEGDTFLLTSVRHRAVEPASYRSSMGGGQEYENTITCVPESVSFRPPRVTPKPTIRGVQTATVVGPADEEIYTDKYGRIKVQFHWDRHGHHDENSSCWIRVAQAFAGSRYGVHFWPRIGHEVVVTFLEGDPDRPLIIASVYNADNMPPYALPRGQTRCGVKTRSSKNGTSQNFNEIRFEDEKGKEEVYIHAENSLNAVVEGDETRSVGHDQKIKVKNDRHVEVENDDLLDVTETRKITAKKIILNADQEIFLQCGGGTIKIDAAGNVTINGTKVYIN